MRPLQAERQRQDAKPGLAVRGTSSPASALRPAVGSRLTEMIGRTITSLQRLTDQPHDAYAHLTQGRLKPWKTGPQLPISAGDGIRGA